MPIFEVKVKWLPASCSWLVEASDEKDACLKMSRKLSTMLSGHPTGNELTATEMYIFR